MDNNFNNLNVINTLLRWRMHLIIILIIALIGSVVFSGPWMITPKYKSWAVVYPANISPYSEESETEQMFQIMQASYIRDKVIEKFDLAKHYDISPNYKHFKTALINEYNDNVSVSKTPGEAIQIEVLDSDPEVASEMVKYILETYNQKIKKLHKQKFLEVVEVWERAIARKNLAIDSLENELNTLAMEYGLVDFESQSEQLAKGILGTVEGGSTRINDKEVAKLRESIQKKGGKLLVVVESLENEAANLALLSNEYDIAYSNYDRIYTYTNVIEDPFVSDKKASPVRWLIVVLTMFTTLFLSLLIIGIIENLRIRKA